MLNSVARLRFDGDVGAIALFAVGYAVVDLVPVALPQVPVFFGLGLPEAVDMALVFLLVGLYVLLGVRAGLWRGPRLRAANVAALLMLVQGHSIHLAANAITGVSRPGDSGWQLAYFLDEHWGHAELHLSFVLFAVLFIGWGQSSGGQGGGRRLSLVERAGLYVVTVAYGVWLAGGALEGQTVPLMLPAGLALFLWGLWPQLRIGRRRDSPPASSVYRAFFAASFGVMAAALVSYGVAFEGFPQPFSSM